MCTLWGAKLREQSNYTNHCLSLEPGDLSLKPPPTPDQGTDNLRHIRMMGMTPSLPSWGQWRSSLVLLRWRSGCSLLTPDPTILIHPELPGLCWAVLLVLACRREVVGVKPEMHSCGGTFKQVFTSFQLYKHFPGSSCNTILSPPFPPRHLCHISGICSGHWSAEKFLPPLQWHLLMVWKCSHHFQISKADVFQLSAAMETSKSHQFRDISAWCSWTHQGF